MGFLGDVNAPLAAIAPKNLRPVLHPIGAIRREAGDTAGTIIDPFGAFAEAQKNRRKPSPQHSASAARRRSSLLTGE